MQVTRQYHSTALLLPDGRVLSSGGGICGDCDAQGYLAKNAEVFSPPYLYRQDGSGQLAPRPTITSSPGTVSYNAPFTINTPSPGAIGKVAMVRLGAVTHSVNMEQRYVPLSFTTGGGNITATAPLNANIAPPGFYMLFLIGTDGVPSVANMVRIDSDTTAPAAPTVTDTDPDSPSNDNSPEVKGSAETGSTVRIYSTGTCTGSPLATGSAASFGGAGITTPVPENQTTNLRATATDAAGNASACSSAFTYIEDSTGPATPSITDTDPDSPSSDQNPEVKGSAEAGSTVRIYSTATCTGSPLATGSAASFGGAGITTPVPENQTTNLRATATDAVGNASACSSALAYVEDSSGPGAPSITDTDPDSPANDNNPEVKGSADSGSTVRIFSTSDCSGTPLATGSAAGFGGAGLTTPVPGDQTANLRATATDAVGNASACSAAFAYTEDSTAPAAPSLTDTDPDPPANDNNPEVKGSAQTGSTVRIYSTGDCSGTQLASGTAAQLSGTGITTPVPADQTTNLRATATDAAGNASACSSALPYTEDSGAPATPSITDTDPDSPSRDNDPEVKGSGAEAGSTVRIYGDAGCSGTVLGSGSATAFNGTGGITATVPADQTTSLRVAATDAAGNASACSAAFTYTEDSSTPAAPSLTDTDPDSPANDNNPEVKGSAEAGSTVRIYSTATCTGTALATGSAAQLSGAGITTPVAGDQTTSLRATATDAVGNPSACSSALPYSEDSTAPATPSITDTDPDSPAGDNDPEVKGSAEAGSTVRIYSTPDCSGTALASGTAAQFSSPGLTITVANNQASDLRATATDAAGNASACSSAFTYTEDSTAPATPSITDTDPDSPAERQRPRGQGLGRGGLDRPDLLDRDLHRIAPGDRQRRQLRRRRDHDPGAGEPDHQPPRHRHRRRRQRLGLLVGARLRRGLERPRGPLDHRHRPRLPGQRQQPRGEGQRRLGLDREDLLDLRLFRDAARDRQRRRLRRRRAHDPGPGRPDRQPPRHRHRRRRQRLSLLGGVRLHRGLDRPRGSQPDRHRPGPAGERQQPGGQGVRADGLDRSDLLDRGLLGHAARQRHGRPALGYRDHDPGPRRPDHEPEGDGDRRRRQRIGLLVRPPLHRGFRCTGHPVDHRHRPRLALRGQRPRGEGIRRRGRLDRSDLRRRRVQRHRAGQRERHRLQRHRRDHRHRARRPDHQPQGRGDRRGGQRLRLLGGVHLHRGLLDPGGSEPDRHRPRLARQRQQPRGQGLGRGGLDGPDLLDRDLHRHRARDRQRRPALGCRDHDPGRRRPDHQPPRHRHRRRRQRLGLLVRASLQRGLDRAGHPVDHRHRPRLARRGQRPRGQGIGRGGLDGEDLLDPDCSGTALASGTAAQFSSPGSPSPSPTTRRATSAPPPPTRPATPQPARRRSPTSRTRPGPPPPRSPTPTPTPPPSDNNPEVKGSAEAGSTVRIYSTATCTGSPLATGSAASFGGAGITTPVPENQTTNLRATATDAAGNASACSSALAYVEDSSGPGAPSITDTDPDSPANDNNPEVKGSADSGSTVRIFSTSDCSGTPLATGSAAGFGGAGLTTPVPGDQTANLRATATDAVGNASACSAAFAYTEDSTAPAAPSLTDTDPDPPANDNNPEVKGSAQTGSTVRIYSTGDCSGTQLASGTAAQLSRYRDHDRRSPPTRPRT